ncbi:hypothetical protein ACFLX5_03875 [Chloroflexota bacterium]
MAKELKEQVQGDSGDMRGLRMEQSGHWPRLRQTARKLQEQLSAPLDQLLGFSRWRDHNPALTLVSAGQDLTVTLQVEQEVLYDALKCHLPDDRAWSLLDEWKTKVKDISQGLERLCAWVRQQQEMKGKQWLSREESFLEALGLTDQFTKLIVKNSVEDAYFNRSVEDTFYRSCMEKEYEQRLLQGGNRHELVCQDAYVIAVSEDSGELEDLKHLHKDLRDRIRDIPELKALLKAYREREEVKEALDKELDRIANLAIFPRICDLCRG